MNRISACIVAAFVLLSGAVAFSAAAPTTVIVGYAALNPRVLPLSIAHEQGMFNKYGLDAEPIFIRGAPTLVAGLASGDIPLGRSGGSAMLAAVAAGHDF